MSRIIRSLAGQTLSCLVVLSVSLSTCRAEELDFLMDSVPRLEVPAPVVVFNPELKKLWLQALARPEADYQRMAAETVARAHQSGLTEFSDAIPVLEKIVGAESSNPASRFAAARTLIVLDSHKSAQLLFETSQKHGADLRLLIEPALARWQFDAARTVWLTRLESSGTKRRDKVLAIRGLAELKDASAVPKLMTIAINAAGDADLRLEAATAIGKLSNSGLEQDAEKLARQSMVPPFIGQLCAVRVLAQHNSDGSQQILTSLAANSEPAVVVAALQRLNAIDAKLVLPLSDSAMKSPDPLVRLEGAKAILQHPTTDRLAALIPFLADAHPAVRVEVRKGLAKVAESADYTEAVHSGAMQFLAGDSWQGQEQAAILLGQRDHEPAATRLVELLESPQDEVLVTAAWALRSLAVPETAAAIIDKAKRQTELRKTDLKNDSAVSVQIALMFEALGVLKATDAMPLLLEYVPKQLILGDRPRGAAIWAIGSIHEGVRNASVEDLLADRINDFNELTPETTFVKQMSMLALARMNAVESGPMLKELAPSFSTPPEIEAALHWSVLKLTGEKLPPAKPPNARQLEWFLEPLTDNTAAP